MARLGPGARLSAIVAFVGASAVAGVLTKAPAGAPRGAAVEADTVAPAATMGGPAREVVVVVEPTGAVPPSTPRVPGGIGPLVEAPPPAFLLPPVESERPTRIEVFFSPLSAHGEWILIEGYGRCWRPRVAVEVGWHPYARGQWIATDVGWSWRSDEGWGEWRSAPYHYGRWSLEARGGWVWVPDVVWAPSWVEWRSCDGYVGWAPTPAEYRWAGGKTEVHALGVEAFIFVPSKRFLEPAPGTWRVSGDARGEVFVKAKPIAETVTVEGVVVHVGPPVPKVALHTGVAVTPVKITPSIVARRGGPGPGHGAGVGVGGGVSAGPGGVKGGGGPAGPASGKPAGHGGHGGRGGGR